MSTKVEHEKRPSGPPPTQEILAKRKKLLTQLATIAEPGHEHTNQSGAVAFNATEYLAQALQIDLLKEE